MISEGKNMQQACVLKVSGRTLQLYDGQIFQASAASRALKPIVGDIVTLECCRGQNLVRAIKPRRNCLTRTFGTLDKEVVANLDRLFLVCAGGALFNTSVIDRVLCIAWREKVPVTLVLNKCDLGPEPRFDIYKSAGVGLLELSARFGQGFERLEAALLAPVLGFTALCGVSGVGKSTILNRLVPDAGRKTAEVSVKTGQGRQTTSEIVAYLYRRTELSPLLIADLPGVQYFGVSHLSIADVALSFPEFAGLRELCEYADCLHAAEPRCAVKAAVEAGKLAASRYESYLGMLSELQQMPEARKYRKRKPGERPLQAAFKGVKDSRE